MATGLTMLPQGVITGVGTVLGQRVLIRVSVRVAVLTGFVVLTVAGLGLLAIDAHPTRGHRDAWPVGVC